MLTGLTSPEASKRAQQNPSAWAGISNRHTRRKVSQARLQTHACHQAGANEAAPTSSVTSSHEHVGWQAAVPATGVDLSSGCAQQLLRRVKRQTQPEVRLTLAVHCPLHTGLATSFKPRNPGVGRNATRTSTANQPRKGSKGTKQTTPNLPKGRNE